MFSVLIESQPISYSAVEQKLEFFNLSILELDVLLNVKTGAGNRNRIPHEHSECGVQMRGTSSDASVKRENDMVKVLTF
jgi:hypothetical protein